MSRSFLASLLGGRPKRRPPERPSSAPDPEHAWRALALVNEWIRHSDSKAGVTFAFVGVLGTMIFSLANNFETRTLLFDVLVVIACSLLVATSTLCALTLIPRIDDFEPDTDSINRLFFVSISQHFRGQRKAYVDVLHTLISDPAELTRDIAHQVHANAIIATVKAKYAKYAIGAAIATSAFVAAMAIVVGITNS